MMMSMLIYDERNTDIAKGRWASTSATEETRTAQTNTDKAHLRRKKHKHATFAKKDTRIVQNDEKQAHMRRNYRSTNSVTDEE